ncbi:MAG: hypothetical protein Q9186_001716 [Xanthomendoza sp. 1 TL-2023]
MGLTENSIIDHEAIRKLSESKLNHLGFMWEDVEEILPVTFPATRAFLKDVPNYHREVFSYSAGDLATLESAVRGTFHSWQLLRSIAIDTGEGPPLLLVLRYNDRYVERAIARLPEVSSRSELATIGSHGGHWKGEVPRGLLCTAAVAKASGSGDCAVALVVNHAIIDDIVSRRLYVDFLALLTGGSLCEKVNWSLFSNVYRDYITSLPAEEALHTHLKRLQGMRAFHASLWPQNKEPSEQLSCSSNKNGSQSLEAVEDVNHSIQCSKVRRVPRMQSCRSGLHIRPAIVTKAAIAMFNCRTTNTRTALIAVALSGRIWPFLDDAVARFLPDPRLIAGPTISMCTDIIKLDPAETIAQMLKRLDQEQRLISRYPHCPLSILQHFTDEDRCVWALARKQIFNWLPFDQIHVGVRDDSSPILGILTDKGSKVDEETDEFTWRCGMIDEEQLRIEVSASGVGFDSARLEAITEQVFDLVEALADNGNWDTNVEKLLSQLN